MTRRLIALIAGVVLLLVAVALFVRSCDKRRSQAAQTRVERSQAEAASNSAADAVNAVAASSKAAEASEGITRENDKTIRAAPGASDPVNPGARDAGIAALCRRQAYRNDPRCKP